MVAQPRHRNPGIRRKFLRRRRNHSRPHPAIADEVVGCGQPRARDLDHSPQQRESRGSADIRNDFANWRYTVKFLAAILLLASSASYATHPETPPDPASHSSSSSSSAATASSAATGGNSSATSGDSSASNALSVSYKDRLQAPSIGLAPVYASGPCAVGWSLGGSIPGGSLGGGKSKVDQDCNRRELARVLIPLNPQLALKVLCADPIVAAVAKEGDCVYSPPVVATTPPPAPACVTKEAVDKAFKACVGK
jgi:hypothetical protein